MASSYWDFIAHCCAIGLVLLSNRICALEPLAPEDYHGLVLDAGSTGTRIHVYAWQPVKCGSSEPPPLVVPRHVASFTVNPGVTSFVDDVDNLHDSLLPLINFAKETLQSRQHEWYKFPVYCLATAGVRRQRPENRDILMRALRRFLEASPFRFEPDFLRILSGEEEGALGWVALNAGLGLLDSQQREESVGVIDLGGASFQITFAPGDGHYVLQHAYPLLLRGRPTILYSGSYLQFGVREARRLLQRQLIAHSLIKETVNQLRHPCLLRGESITEDLIRGVSTEDDASTPLRAVWHGSGDYDACSKLIQELFDKRAPCYNPPCTFDGRYQPRLGKQRFIAFSTFSHIVSALALPTNGTIIQDVENAARYICKMDWAALGERWRDLDDNQRRHLCFTATYVVVLLEYGLGFDRNTEQIQIGLAQEKLSWAFGAIVLEVNQRFDAIQPTCLPLAQNTSCAATVVQ